MKKRITHGISIKKKTIIFFAAMLFGFVAEAQYMRPNKMEIGLAAGGMSYIGDLNNQSMLSMPRPGGLLLVRYNPNNRWTFQISGGYGQVQGGYPDYIELRNLSFRSSIIEASMQVQFNFLPFATGMGSHDWTPYIFVGFGFFGFNPKAEYINPVTGESEWYALQPLGTEGQGSAAYPERTKYQLLEKMMPFGLGFKWKTTKYLTLGIEYGFRKTWTDYLDDVSTTYVERDILSANGGNMAVILGDRSNEIIPGYINAAGIKRGDDSLNDWYSFMGITVTIQMDAVISFLGLGPKCKSGW